MRQMPRFIKIGPTLNTDPSAAGNVHLDDYKPLLALWLIDLALSRHWITEPPSGSLRITFVNIDFMGITGMYKLAVLLRGEDDDEDDADEADLASDAPLRQRTRSVGKTRPKRDSQSVLRQKLHKLFTNRRAELMLQDVRPDLPLFQNIDRLGRMVNLNETEQAVLTFAACMNCFSGFRNALASILEQSFGVTVMRVDEYDDAGTVFGRPDQVELDIIIKNGLLLICELKSSIDKAGMYIFERKARYYEQRHGQTANRLIVISPMIDPRAQQVADQLGIETFSDSLDVATL
jgi:hypothetical protein